MDKVIAFCLGVFLYWFVTGFTQQEITDNLSETWKQAYQMGKNDGYSLGKSEYSYCEAHDQRSDQECNFRS